MSDTAIRVEDLSKQYRIGQREPYKTLRDTLTDALLSPFRSRPNPIGSNGGENTIWALRDVSFEVKHGEAVGIIGRNGAGKSTLLKILSRITAPTTGRALVIGRIGSLLEVGTGFNTELTGRENIYLNSAILGMKRREIERKFDQIVAFAEIEKFLDTPVKRYSSGMYMRLAFSVAAHLEPDILLVDEVLAVGDVSFQKKCLGKMDDVANEGRTVLFVSHNLGAVWSLCPSTIWIDAGRIRDYGASEKIIGDYRNAMTAWQDISLADSADRRRGTGRIRFTNIYLQQPDGGLCEAAQSGRPICFVLEYTSPDETLYYDDVEFNLVILDDRETRLFGLSTTLTNERFQNMSSQGRVKCYVPNLPLVPGEYNLHCSCAIHGVLADKVEFGARFLVNEGDFFGSGHPGWPPFGNILVQHHWYQEQFDNIAM